MKEQVDRLKPILQSKSPREITSYLLTFFKRGDIALATSLGAEDQVLTEMIASIDNKIKIFTLDTGRLFPETYELIEATNKKYGVNIELYKPDPVQVDKMVAEKGIDLFYESIENRKLCCSIRKTEPLKRALHGLQVWICGLRKDQSLTRFYNEVVEWDEANNLIKVNPLINWTEKQVWDYIKQNNVPYNKLHDQNFPSIGCQPCTRAIKPGEDVRAGRWWWEQPEQKECGLHNRK